MAFVLIGLIIVFIFGAILGFSALVTRWAWNAFMHGVFHLPLIGFWQAWAANLLIAVASGLFKGLVTIEKK